MPVCFQVMTQESADDGISLQCGVTLCSNLQDRGLHKHYQIKKEVKTRQKGRKYFFEGWSRNFLYLQVLPWSGEILSGARRVRSDRLVQSGVSGEQETRQLFSVQ